MDGMNIYYNYTVEVNNTKHMATLKEGDIHLYIGDKNIDYYFKVEKAQFTFRGTSETESLIESTMPSKAAVSVLKPNGDIVIGSEAEVVGSRIKWTVTPDLIDEDVEVGDFTLAISLIESSTDSMATLPPITNQIHIHERVTPTPGSSLNAVVNEAVVGLAQVQSDDTALDVFDSEGNYIKTVWKSGDKITQTKLNKIEEAIYQVNTQCKDIANEIANGNIGNNVEPSLMDMPRLYFSEGTLPTSKTSTTMKFDYYSKTKEEHGYVDIKCQGNSSMSYNKKNFTIKLYKDEGLTEKLKIDFKGWGKQSKFVLKANWIDITHARNIVSARLWGDIVKSRTGYANLPELFRTSPNQGAIDGFPVLVYSNGVYQGRYTLNIPKDKWMSNMDDALDTHCILCGENYKSGAFLELPSINGSDWTDELHDTVPDTIKARWTEVISFVMNSTDENFKANLNNYFDIESIIDYLLFGLVSTGLDAFAKNQIFFTYDGLKWIASMYDMDSTWGLYWTGGKIVSSDYDVLIFSDGTFNLLYQRLLKLFINEIKARYTELRKDVLSASRIIERFEEFIQICPQDIVKEDYASTTGAGKFTEIPSTSTNNIQQLRSYIVARLTYVDTYISSLEESIACTGITLDNSTLTFTTTDTQTLTATVTPSDTTDTITWESSDTSIATVSNGIVTPIANGTCTITATCGEQSATCSVTVSGIITQYTITNNLTNCTTSNIATTIEENSSYLATITANEGYVLATVVITMGENDITSSSYADGVITIENVTGNIVINVTTSIQEIDDTNPVYTLAQTTTFNGTSDYIDTGVNLFDTDKDFTIYINITEYNSTSEAILLSCMHNTGGYPGFCLKDKTNRIQIDSYGGAKTIYSRPSKIVITKTSGNNSIDIYNASDSKNTLEFTNSYSSISENLLIGATETTSGEKTSFWSGAIEQCKVWLRVLNTDEITSLYS